ncbi:MAG: DUF6682 family protein [Mycobacterium sp.]
MSTVVAQNLINRAVVVLQDTTNVRWPETELLDWLNDGQRECALLAPDAYTEEDTVTLGGGSAQSIPADGIRLVDVPHNGSTGSPGRAIRPVDRAVLDAQRPDWHNETASGTVKHYTFDDRNPTRFYVYPPATGGATVTVVSSKSPPDVAAGDVIRVEDVYANAILDYMLYRAYSKDAEYAGNDNRAVQHFQAFQTSLGAKPGADASVEPSITRRPQE